MNRRILAIMLCAVVLTAAGCGGKSENSAAGATEQKDEAADVTEPAQSGNEAVETIKEISPEEAAAAERRRKAEEAAADHYESEDGWSVRYNSELVDLEEGKGYVRFTYNGDANATNRIEFRYYPYTSTDIVLADATEDYDREDLERSEGYFAGMEDMWCFHTDLVSDGRYSTRGYTAVEYNEGVLLVEKRGSIETDEERGELISDTMSVILDSVRFTDPEPQEEYDYVPGKYMLVQETKEDAGVTDAAAVPAGAAGYPAYIALGKNHMGRLGYGDPVDIIWYSRDCLIKEDNESGAIYYYSIEGDSLYLEIDGNWIEYRKDLGAAVNVDSVDPGEKDVQAFKTYENENGWYVYYDSRKFTIKESRGEVDFIFGTSEEVPEDAEMLKVKYIGYDHTDEVLADETRNYSVSEVIQSEGYIGGGKDAWGFTVSLPASGDGTVSARKLTAVEHNEGVLLFDRPDHSGGDSGEGVGNAFEDIINTFMFTDHDPQEEYDYVPGRYLLNDRKLQKAASNYPVFVRLNKDHSGMFGGNDERDIVWYSRKAVIVETGPGGASYNYRIEDDTLYIQMDDEWVEYDKEDRDD